MRRENKRIKPSKYRKQNSNDEICRETTSIKAAFRFLGLTLKAEILFTKTKKTIKKSTVKMPRKIKKVTKGNRIINNHINNSMNTTGNNSPIFYGNNNRQTTGDNSPIVNTISAEIKS